MKKQWLVSLMACLCLLPAFAVGEAADTPLMVKGLTVTGLGLGGVFLVLVLFYIMIKLISRIGVKRHADAEDRTAQG